MGFLLLLLFVVLAGFGLWFWCRPLAGGRWRHSAGWFTGTVLAIACLTYAVRLAVIHRHSEILPR
jgi:hypothetical protein